MPSRSRSRPLAGLSGGPRSQSACGATPAAQPTRRRGGDTQIGWLGAPVRSRCSLRCARASASELSRRRPLLLQGCSAACTPAPAPRHAHRLLEIAMLLILHAARPPAISPSSAYLEFIVFNQERYCARHHLMPILHISERGTQHTAEPASNPVHYRWGRVRPREGRERAQITQVKNWEMSLFPGSLLPVLDARYARGEQRGEVLCLKPQR